MGESIRLRVNNEIPAYRPGLVSALDIGSSKIACVIGRAEQGTLKILGSALRESAGIRAMTVEVGFGNAPAQTVYRRAGFSELPDRQLLGFALAAPTHLVLDLP